MTDEENTIGQLASVKKVKMHKKIKPHRRKLVNTINFRKSSVLYNILHSLNILTLNIGH